MESHNGRASDHGFVCELSSAPRPRRSTPFLRWRVLRGTPMLAIWLTTFATPAAAQLRTSIGLSSVGAAGLHLGRTRVERDADGQEAGLQVDFGWLRSPSLRLRAEVAMVRATLTEFVEVEDRTYDDQFFDLTGSLALVALLRDAGHRVVPYVTVGIGVHALSSSFGSTTIDRRYNANHFGSHAGAGAQLRLANSGGFAIFAEARRTIAEQVNRTSFRLGGLVLFNDLRRPRR